MKSISMPLWVTGLMLATSLLTSCEDKLAETTPGKPTDVVSADSNRVYKEGMFNGTPIRYKLVNGDAVWQGDIELTPEQLGQAGDSGSRTAGSGVNDLFARWPNGVIPYEIASNFDQVEKNRIKDAIALWQDRTSITFVPRTSHTDYVRFVITDVNRSKVGKIGGMQEIKLIKFVNPRAIVHEIGHAIGLLHEHTRSDRDNWITVKWENVDDEGQYELQTYATNFPWYPTFNKGAVDFQSAMIYDPTAYSKNGKPTMVRKDNGPAWTGINEISSGDVKTVEHMYANLYMVRGNLLWSVSTKKEFAYSILSSEWLGTAKGIAQQERYIWAIQGGKLWRIDRFTAERQAMGNEDWSGPVVGLTGAEPGGFFYAQQGKRLWKIGGNGKRERLGGVNGQENWSGTQAIYNHKGALYVVWKNTLYKINIKTGLVDKTYYGSIWTDVKGIAASYIGANSIFIMQGSDLWSVNIVTGAFNKVQSNILNVTAMSGVDGSLFMVAGNYLYRVSEEGKLAFLSNGWGGVSSMGTTRNFYGTN
ncbi:M12 family metallopeptidase [Dyadobacter sp. CY107]|uniref:M12 family metallopeptidase n=1 Tax=Dyadobacter fanqingshengii TaxID=2906443 RepID=UPI001F40AC10|nr:M12 family metallopeptidase [Dyadobacter fanqingshengii]MCF2502099.1 M12 family metallopeptidase [Dyadobacter fanqingshengii]